MNQQPLQVLISLVMKFSIFVSFQSLFAGFLLQESGHLNAYQHDLLPELLLQFAWL